MSRLTILTLAVTASVAASAATSKPAKKSPAAKKPDPIELLTIEVGKPAPPTASPAEKPAASPSASPQKTAPRVIVVAPMTAPLKRPTKPQPAKKPAPPAPPTANSAKKPEPPSARPAPSVQRPTQQTAKPVGPPAYTLSAPIDLSAMVREGRATLTSSKIVGGKLDFLFDPNRSTEVACLSMSTSPAYWQVTLDRPRPLDAVDLAFGEGGPFQWTLAGALTSADLQSRQGTYRVLVPSRTSEADDQVDRVETIEIEIR